MGSLYRPKYKDRHGMTRESAVWWVRYRQHGKTVRQSTETTLEAKARRFLQEHEGKVALNIPVSPKADRLTLGEAADLIRQDYKANNRKSLNSLEPRLAHLLRHLGSAVRLARVTTGTVETYKVARLAEKAASATINRELAALQRMAALVRHQYGLVSPFVVERLEERNVRTGFFEDDAFAAVRSHLRPELAALASVARITGWRKSELRSRHWRHVDFAACWLRLEPEETKNREGRMFPLIPELRVVLEAQRARVEAILASPPGLPDRAQAPGSAPLHRGRPAVRSDPPRGSGAHRAGRCRRPHRGGRDAPRLSPPGSGAPARAGRGRGAHGRRPLRRRGRGLTVPGRGCPAPARPAR
jgi:hypothetical protein